MNTSHPSRAAGSRRRLAAGAAVAAAGALIALSLPSAAVAADEPTTIDLYDINDFHGRLEAGSAAPVPGDVAGAAVLAGAVDALEARNPNSLLVSAGDNIGASTFTSFVQEDQPTIDALNATGLSVSAIGNHELDGGRADLRDRVIGAEGARNAQFDYVSANIVDTTTGEPAFAPYAIKEIGGKRVGFIGATTEKMPELVAPSGIEGLAFTDVVDTVNAYADDLTDGDERNGEADVLVALVHEGAADSELSSSTDDSDFGHIAKDVSPKVSVIFSGHTHALYAHDIVPTGGTVPRPVIQTESYGTYLGHARIQVAADGSVTATGENLTLAGSGYEADPEVAQIVADAAAIADEEGKVQVGTIDQSMLRAKQADGTENRGGESTLGNFIAEVQKTQTERNGAQVAFMNPGGLRADMLFPASGDETEDGIITYEEAAAVQPFANTLVVEDLTGAQIKQALEQQWQPAGASRPFLKLGVSEGFSYTYDNDAAAGERIGEMTLDGAPVDLDTTYKVTVNSFLASGGDNFGAFDEAAAKADSGTVDLQAQVDYFTANEDVIVADDQRAVGVRTTPTPAVGFQPGDQIELALSSLTFSNAPDQGGEVSVSAGDQVLDTADIDTTIVSTTDEQGRATLAFTVPEVPSSGATTTRAAAVTDERLVISLPNGQEITLGTTIPVATADVPTDPTDPGTPGDGETPGDGVPGDGETPDDGGQALPGGGDGTDDGAGTGTDGEPSASDTAGGDLAWTGADLTAPAVAAGLLLLAGVTALVAVRRKRARRDATVLTD